MSCAFKYPIKHGKLEQIHKGPSAVSPNIVVLSHKVQLVKIYNLLKLCEGPPAKMLSSEKCSKSNRGKADQINSLVLLALFVCSPPWIVTDGSDGSDLAVTVGGWMVINFVGQRCTFSDSSTLQTTWFSSVARMCAATPVSVTVYRIAE